MLKTVVLLFAMAMSIDCGAIRYKNNKEAVLKEIIRTLIDIDVANIETAGCQKPMVMDIFSNTTGLEEADAFCKAAKTLKHITPCHAMHNNIEKLKENLQKVGKKATNCIMDHLKIDLKEFLTQLLTFARCHYHHKP